VRSPPSQQLRRSGRRKSWPRCRRARASERRRRVAAGRRARKVGPSCRPRLRISRATSAPRPGGSTRSFRPAPVLVPRTSYGCRPTPPDDKVICFFQPKSKFKVRNSTIGFQPDAKLDERTFSGHAVSASRSGCCIAMSNATTNSNYATASTSRPTPRCTIAMFFSVVASPVRSLRRFGCGRVGCSAGAGRTGTRTSSTELAALLAKPRRAAPDRAGPPGSGLRPS
jgi:hypothetical protein